MTDLRGISTNWLKNQLCPSIRLSRLQAQAYTVMRILKGTVSRDFCCRFFNESSSPSSENNIRVISILIFSKPVLRICIRIRIKSCIRISMAPHHFGNLDPHPHQIKIRIRNQNPDPHQREMLIWIRINSSVLRNKNFVRFCNRISIKVMRIHNTGVNDTSGKFATGEINGNNIRLLTPFGDLEGNNFSIS